MDSNPFTIQNLQKILEKHDLNNFQGSSENAAQYYFKMMQKLYIQNIYLQVDVNHLKNSIKDLNERHASLEQQKLTIEKKNKQLAEQRNEEFQEGTFKCRQFDCGKEFLKTTKLELHQILTHRQPRFDQESDVVFGLEYVEEWDESQVRTQTKMRHKPYSKYQDY